MLRFVFVLSLTFLVLRPPQAEGAGQHDHEFGQSDRMGKVQFDTSCSPEVHDEFDLAVATLHSFGYRKSAQLFADVLSRDPKCSMAEWGIAMSHYRQLWDPPTPDDLQDRPGSRSKWSVDETAYSKGTRLFGRDSGFLSKCRLRKSPRPRKTV